MEDFIYIILLLAWVVFAFYRRSQKKAEAARQAASQPEQPHEYRPMPTLEEILMGGEINLDEEPEQAPEPAPPFLPKQVQVTQLKETAFEKEYKSRGITSIEELSKTFRSYSVPEPEMADKVPLSDGKINDIDDIRFNLRQAVIYSEILNRPYD